MKFDIPATINPIDQFKVVGKPTDRIEGPLNTMGAATYAYEQHDAAPNQAYGFLVGRDRERPDHFDPPGRAKAAPGVLGVVTAEDAGQA